MSEYYDALHATGDPTTAAGWRHPLEQAMRFEVALESLPDSVTSLLDVGAGTGALLDYARATRESVPDYTGLERLAGAASLATHDRVLVSDVHDPSHDGSRWDAVVAIGAVVDGAVRRDALARVHHVRVLLRRMASLCDDALCLIVLDQSALEADVTLSLEPVLCGARPDELRALASELLPGWRWEVRDDFAPSDLALCARRVEPLPEFVRWSAHERALSGPWGRDASARERAWLWFVSGRMDEARSWCERAVREGDARAEILLERIDAQR